MSRDHWILSKVARVLTTFIAFVALMSSVLTVVLENSASATGVITEAATFPVSVESLSPTGVTSLTVVSQHVGDLLIFSSQIHSQAITVTGVASTGTGTTGTWTLAHRYVDTTNGLITEEIWWAVVTGTGSTTITAAYSGDVSALTPELVVDSFVPATATIWKVVASNGAAATSASTIAFPSLTSGTNNQLYWGYAESTQTASAGSSTGFTYSTVPQGNIVTRNVALTPSTVYAPTASATGGNNTSIGAIFADSAVTQLVMTTNTCGSHLNVGGATCTLVATLKDGSGNPVVDGTAVTFTNGGAGTVTGLSSVTNNGDGTYSVTVTASGDGSISITANDATDGFTTSPAVTFTVQSTSPAVSFSNGSTGASATDTMVYGASYSANATATGGGTITYTATGCTVGSSSGGVTATTVGTPCVVTANDTANGNYAAGTATLTITITSSGGAPPPAPSAQAALTLTSTSGTYGSSLTLTSSGGSGTGAVSYVVTSAGTAGCSVSAGTLSATSAGSCTVTVTKTADTNYLVASSAATTVTFRAKVVPVGLHAIRVNGFVWVGRTVTVTIVGTGFYGQPTITSNEAGTSAVVSHDNGRALVVRVRLLAGSARGWHTFTITLANGHSCKVNYLVK
jgi:hypothetical protein